MKEFLRKFTGAMILYSGVAYLLVSLMSWSFIIKDWDKCHLAIFITIIVVCACFTSSRILDKYL